MNILADPVARARTLFSLLCGLLFIIALVQFYRFVSSPTDENVFRDAPSQLYVIRQFPALELIGSRRDTVRVGDMITRIDDQDVSQLNQLNDAIRKNALAKISVFRPSDLQFYDYRVTPSFRLDSVISEIPHTALVTNVIEDGASDRAGMHVGDLILRINGKHFSTAVEADKILTSAQVGKAIAYDVIRQNEIVTFDVTLAKFGFPIFILTMFLVGSMYLFLGGLVVFIRVDTFAARLLGLTFVVWGFFLMAVGQRGGLNREFLNILTAVLRVVSLSLGMAMIVHLRLHFPILQKKIIQRKWPVRGIYGVAFLSAIGFLLVQDASSLYAAIIAFVLYHVVLRILFRKSRSIEYRTMSRLTGWLGIVSLPIIVYSSQNQNQQAIAGVGTAIALLLLPLSYFYTIAHYHLMDLNFRIRRNIQYVLVSFFWHITLIGGAWFFMGTILRAQWDLPNIRFARGAIEILEKPITANERIFLERLVIILIVVTGTWLFLRLRQKGQVFWDRVFYRGEKDYRAASMELTEITTTNLNINDLAIGISRKLMSIMNLKTTGVLFFDDDGQSTAHAHSGMDSVQWEQLRQYAANSLFTMAQISSGTLSLNVDLIERELRTTLRTAGIRFVIPIRSKDQALGVMLVGERLSESPIHHEDLTFLIAVAKQISVAIENSMLYEDLAEQDRLKHELDIARRIQLASLPQSMPVIDGLDIAGISCPAMEVGGDYIDYLDGIKDNLTVIVGDVSGKGTSAALYMSKVQGILHSLHSFDLSPRELFIRSNKILCADLEKTSFVTSIGARFNYKQKTVNLARAGHLSLFYFSAKKHSVEQVTPSGVGLGITDSFVFDENLEEVEIPYETGDIFIFMTDGIPEAQNVSREEFGDVRILDYVAAHADRNSEQLMNGLLETVRLFTGQAEQNDDQTIVVIKAIS